MHIHIVAVAGTGMGALAGLLTELGHRVTGSDVAFDPPMGPALRAWGVECRPGFDPAHLDPAPDLVVIGNVCRPTNPEALAARERGLPFTHIAGALQRFALDATSPLVVAGTHGKTTTSALAAWLLHAAGEEPGFLVGGIPRNFDRSFRAPRGGQRLPRADRPPRRAPFVVEGDEYDTAYFEKTAKFLHYRAEVAIVTSIEHDHVDIYPTLESYEEAFRRFIAGVPEGGLVVANAADERVVALVQAEARAPVAWYAVGGQRALAPAHWLAEPAGADPSGQAFDLFAGGVAAGRFVLPLPGRHNLSNATAAVAAAAQGYGVPLTALHAGLAAFQGVKRRQEVLGTPGGVTVIDDFAHHPTAVHETLSALRQRYPQARLWAVFEPRSATACRRIHQAAYAGAFDLADKVVLAPLGRSNLPPEEALDLPALVAELGARGRPAELCADVDAVVAAVAREAAPGDVVALLSNGAFGGAHGKVLAALSARAAGA